MKKPKDGDKFEICENGIDYEVEIRAWWGGPREFSMDNPLTENWVPKYQPREFLADYMILSIPEREFQWGEYNGEPVHSREEFEEEFERRFKLQAFE